MVQAGELGSFEKAVSSPPARILVPAKPGGGIGVPAQPAQGSSRRPAYDTHQGCGLDCALVDVVLQAVMPAVGMFTMVGLARVGLSDEMPLDQAFEPRQLGDIDLPFLAAEVSQQQIGARTTALDQRAEVGVGPFALQVRKLVYDERAWADHLEIEQVHGVFRIAVNRIFQLGLGGGQSLVRRQTETVGSSFTLPMTVCPDESWCWRFIPTWNHYGLQSSAEYDASGAYVMPFGSLRLGYRWTQAGYATLSGPYMGLALHF
jgi:hypothetical protein